MAVVLIGIDDTDSDTSPGTGRLARRLSGKCEEQGMKPLGVTRHQFLLDPGIPYTSHNSGACVAIASDSGVAGVDFAFDFVAEHAAEGSDPGVCIARADTVASRLTKFAVAATETVLEKQEALTVAKVGSVALRGLGGSCQGVIGALASVGLRAEGNSGRFIDLPGLRELADRVHVLTFEQMGIRVRPQNGGQLHPDDTCDTLGWVRPRLVGGKPVLLVEWSDQRNAWIPVDKKDKRRSVP